LSVFGGRAYGAEPAIAVALRELREETGLRPKAEELIPVATVPYLINEGSQRCMLCSYFVLKNILSDRMHVAEGTMCQLTPDEALARDDLTDLPRRMIEVRMRTGLWPTPTRPDLSP